MAAVELDKGKIAQQALRSYVYVCSTSPPSTSVATGLAGRGMGSHVKLGCSGQPGSRRLAPD